MQFVIVVRGKQGRSPGQALKRQQKPAPAVVVGTDGVRLPFAMPRCSEKTIALAAQDVSGRARQRLSCACHGAAFVQPGSGSCSMGRGLLLWMLGIPIPVIILLYVFHVI